MADFAFNSGSLRVIIPSPEYAHEVPEVPTATGAEGQSIQNKARSESKWFRIKEARAPVAQLDRASAF